MAVRIAHASIDENGKAHGGAAGDQTGKEVKVSNWYNKPWLFVLRPKSATFAEKSATIATKLANSNITGYDQYQRNTLHTQMKKFGYDVDKYIASGVKTETDCSAFQTVVAIASGASGLEYADNGNAPVCSNMKAKFSATGMYDVLTDKKYITSSDYLKRGDVLVGSGHTVMAIDNGAKVASANTTTQKTTTTTTTTTTTKSSTSGIEPAMGKNSDYAHTYSVTASALNVRKGAGTTKDKIVTIPKGTKVTCYGYFNTDTDGTKWFYVAFNYKGVQYTGYVSSKFLVKC